MILPKPGDIDRKETKINNQIFLLAFSIIENSNNIQHHIQRYAQSLYESIQFHPEITHVQSTTEIHFFLLMKDTICTDLLYKR